MKKNISIIGLGYIGLPFALLLNLKGFNVEAVDIDVRKIDILKKGKFRSEEENINKIYKSLKKKTINFSTKLENSNFYILCLPTPINKNFKCDLSYLVDAINKISKVIKINDTVIIESTVPIGTTNYLKSLIEKKRPEMKNKFNICFSPEKAIPGNTLYEMQTNLNRCKDHNRFNNKKLLNILNQADYVFLVSSWRDWLIPILPQSLERISQKNRIKLTKIGIIQSSKNKSSIVNGKNRVISHKNKGYFHKFK